MQLYFDIGESIVQNGFRRMLLLNGHGSNVNVMNLAARLITIRTPGMAAATSWWDLCREKRREVRESEFPGGMAHACEFETSAYMAIEPSLVRTERIEDCISRINDDWLYSDMDGSGPAEMIPWWSQTSANGTEGRPSLANAGKGEALLSEATENLIRLCEHLKTLELPPVADRRPTELRWNPTRR
jgi:creatinine amidohydrolase